MNKVIYFFLQNTAQKFNVMYLSHRHHIRLLEIDIHNQKGNMFFKCDNITI